MVLLSALTILILGSPEAVLKREPLEPLQRLGCAVALGELRIEDVPIMSDPELAMRVIEKKPIALRKLDLELRALIPHFKWPEACGRAFYKLIPFQVVGESGQATDLY
ncbi:MAG: hypothetical protein AAFX94_01160 [Myxococcota bacterium]